MFLRRFVLGAVLALPVAGAVALTVWPSSPGEERSTDAIPPPPARGEDPSGSPPVPSAARLVGESLPPETVPLGPTKLLAILEAFDDVWMAPRGLQGDARARALGRRDVEVGELIGKAAALAPDVIAEISVRMHGAGSTHPRQIFLMRTLGAIGSEDALRILADLAVSRNAWRVRDLAFRTLVDSPSEAAVEVATEFLPILRDPRFVLPVLQSRWDPASVEVAYRAWLDAAPTGPRSRSYSYLPRVKGPWIDDLLMDVTRSGSPGRERAGAVNALVVRKPEGILSFFRDQLWIEEDPIVIRALVVAIRRVGGEEGRSILAEYAAVGASDDVRAFAEAAVRAPDMVPRSPGAIGGPSERSVPLGSREGRRRLDERKR
jgi:hypothetical protein